MTKQKDSEGLLLLLLIGGGFLLAFNTGKKKPVSGSADVSYSYAFYTRGEIFGVGVYVGNNWQMLEVTQGSQESQEIEVDDVVFMLWSDGTFYYFAITDKAGNLLTEEKLDAAAVSETEDIE